MGLRQLLGHQSSPRARRPRPSELRSAACAERRRKQRVSRYQVYRYEISLGRGRGGDQRLVGKKWLGEQRPTGSAGLRESRQAASRPRAARRFAPARGGVSGVDTTTGGVDRRNLIVPIINCLAQTALGNIAGAGASSKTPVAAFGKFFMTQPYSALKDGNLYGEITGRRFRPTTLKSSISSSCTVSEDRRHGLRVDDDLSATLAGTAMRR